MNTLPLSEAFAPVWQGEGPHAGRRCGFVRLGLCNLSCEWCDTPYTWDTTRYDVTLECPDTPIPEILATLRTFDVNLMVLSGGEPLMHRNRLKDLLVTEWEWHAETNGTIAPPNWWENRVAHTSVSPKVSTRDPAKKRLKPRALSAWAELASVGSACFKFVCATPEDVRAAAEVAEAYRLFADDVWIMPEGTTAEALLTHHRAIAPSILAYGFNTTTRLHTLLHGDQRGH